MFFSLWGPDHDFNIEDVLKELSFFKGVTYYISDFCGIVDPLDLCFNSNLTYYANLVSLMFPSGHFHRHVLIFTITQ